MSKFQHDVMLRVVKILNVLMIELPFAALLVPVLLAPDLCKVWLEGKSGDLGLFFCPVHCTRQSLRCVLDVYAADLRAGLRTAPCGYGNRWYFVYRDLSDGGEALQPVAGYCGNCGAAGDGCDLGTCAHKWYYTTFPPQKTAVVYAVRNGMEKLINEYGLSQKYDVQVTLSVSECLADLSILDGMETVFVSGVHSHERNIILKHCVGKGINMFVIPRVGDVIMSGAWPMHMFHLPMLRVGRYMASPEFLFVKRAMDIVISLAALMILSPLLLITAIAVKSDGGPAFYKQVRLTKDGKPFEILKFRSMRVDAEKDGVARLSTGDKDDRITKVGHIIRACRLDELPQLLNILKGDLSVVGPRPERPEIAAQYCEEMPEFALRLQAKAGLTGYAQVYGKYNTTPYDKLQMDLM